jgi:hypothetical protein
MNQRRFPLLASRVWLPALFCLTACAAPATLSAPPPTDPQAPTAIAATPTAPAVAPDPARRLSGTARDFGGPLAAASVTVRLPGESAVLAQAETDAQGAFSVALSDAVPAGALVEVQVSRAGATVVTLAEAPAARAVMAADTLVISPATTFAFSLLNARFRAAARAAVRASGVDFATSQATLKALDQLTQAAEQALAKLTDPGLQAAVMQAVRPDGAVSLSASAGAAIAANGPTLVAAFSAAATDLASVLRAAIAQGAFTPDAAALAAVNLGRTQASAIRTGGSGGSNGSSSGNGPTPTPTVEPTAEPTAEPTEGNMPEVPTGDDVILNGVAQ